MAYTCKGLCAPGLSSERLGMQGLRTTALPASSWTYKDGRVVCACCYVAFYGDCMAGMIRCPCCSAMLRRMRYPDGTPTHRARHYIRKRERALEAARDARGPRHCRICSTPIPREAHGLKTICGSAPCIHASHLEAMRRYTARTRAARRAELDARTCPDCGLSLKGEHPRRRRCRECAYAQMRRTASAHGARRHQAAVAARPDRHCRICSAPIPREAHGRRTLCDTDACRLAARRQAVNRYSLTEGRRQARIRERDKRRMLAAAATRKKKRGGRS